MFRLWICGALGTALLVGCGDSRPELTLVEGVLTLNGKPLANKSLMLTPIGNTTGHGAGGWSDAEGNYTLIAVVPGGTRGYSGVPPGHYRVTVYGPAPSGNASGEGVETIVADFSVRKSGIPAVYSTDQSPLVVEVPESGGKIDIELRSNPGR